MLLILPPKKTMVYSLLTIFVDDCHKAISSVADDTELYSIQNIPKGKSKEALLARTKLIKSYYRMWVKEHPEKRVWNKDLGNYIYVKGHSINETLAKAATNIESTLAVARLSEVLSQAIVISELPPKDNRNQRIFEKIILMEAPGDVRLLVGLQRSCQEYVQYSIRADKK